MDDYKARIDIARGIASLVPTSDAGETLVALADAVEALVAQIQADRVKGAEAVLNEELRTAEALQALAESRARFGDMEARVVELEAVRSRLRERLSHSQLAAIEEAAPGYLGGEFTVLWEHDAAVWDRAADAVSEAWDHHTPMPVNPYRGDDNA